MISFKCKKGVVSIMRKLFKSESRVKTFCVFLAAFALYVFGVAQANTQTVNTSWIAVENHFDSAQFKSTCAAGTAGGAIYDNALNRNVTATVRAEATR